ncbi:MAG: hypothetical protein RI953_2758 [Pseudomonadota bacterium]|jgi:hypothetical protein
MNDQQNERKNDHRASECLGRPWILATSLALLILVGTEACTQRSKKSALRDLPADSADGGSSFKQMSIKYSFVFIGSSGKKYSIYMNGDFAVGPSGQDGVWNSAIESDGGLVSATTESKTLKPDKNLQLKPTASNTNADPSVVVFSAGNPELGRGLSLSLQKVVSNGATTWKAVGLSYFGYDAQIEDSLASASPGQQKL